MSVLKAPEVLPPPTPENLKRLVDSWTPQFVEYVERIVNISSSSRDEKGLRECAAALEQVVQEILDVPPRKVTIKGVDGIERTFFEVDIVSKEDLPKPEDAANPGRVIHVGHYDTVLDRDEKFSFSNEGNLLKGPGVFDDKGSVIADLFSLRLLQLYGKPELKPWVRALITADEEIGSPDGRKVIASNMDQTFAVLGIEGMDPDESGQGVSVRVGRKGIVDYELTYKQNLYNAPPNEPELPHVTRFVLRYEGLAAHSGTSISKGADANFQSMIDINKIAALDDPTKKVRVTFEAIQGGSASNKVSDKSQVMLIIESDDRSKIELASHVVDQMTPTVNGVKRTVDRRNLDRPLPGADSSQRRAVSNAILQAAIDGEWLKVIQDLDVGISVNPGILKSKPSSDVLCQMNIEGRALTPRHLNLFESTIKSLPTQTPGVSRVLNGGISREAWAQDVGSEKAFEVVRDVHQRFGFPKVSSMVSGGGADVNLVPSDKIRLDGLGILGDGDHGYGEQAFVEDASRAILRLAVTTSELLGTPIMEPSKSSSQSISAGRSLAAPVAGAA